MDMKTVYYIKNKENDQVVSCLSGATLTKFSDNSKMSLNFRSKFSAYQFMLTIGNHETLTIESKEMGI